MNKYLNLAKLASSGVYEDPKSVQASNSAVDSMYSIVRNANKDDIESLIPLLEEAPANLWLAHQLVEIHPLTKEIQNKCFKIITKELAYKYSLEAYGEQQWLKKYEYKFNELSYLKRFLYFNKFRFLGIIRRTFKM